MSKHRMFALIVLWAAGSLVLAAGSPATVTTAEPGVQTQIGRETQAVRGLSGAVKG
jgi:hypothetical protein